MLHRNQSGFIVINPRIIPHFINVIIQHVIIIQYIVTVSTMMMGPFQLMVAIMMMPNHSMVIMRMVVAITIIEYVVLESVPYYTNRSTIIPM